MKSKTMRKIAVVVGINKYPNSRNNLKGCVNDAKALRSVFLKKFKFDKVIMLLDRKATYRRVVKNIKNAMLDLSDHGHFVFTTSSHGTSIPDRSGDESDRRDEAICLYDRVLLDDTFRKLLDNAPVGMKATIITDCCHSGSITRAAFERNFSVQPKGKIYLKPRYLPPYEDEFALATRTAEVSGKLFGSMISQNDMNEILITGCKSDEYSYDAYFNGKYHGALTYNMLEIFKKISGKNITYNEFYKLLKDRLPNQMYPQSPQLEGSKKNKNSMLFL